MRGGDTKHYKAKLIRGLLMIAFGILLAVWGLFYLH
jgi:hypothetical protein